MTKSSALFCSLSLLLAASLYAAPGTTNPAPPSTGSTTSTAPSGVPGARGSKNLDLPIHPPKPVAIPIDPPPKPPPPTPPPVNNTNPGPPAPPDPPAPDPAPPGEDPAPTPAEEEDDPRDSPPPVLFGEEIETSVDTIYYVVDISQSMNGGYSSFVSLSGATVNGDKMARAKAELSRSIMTLADNFQFNIIAFNCSIRSWKSALQDATDPNKQDAVSWINSLRPGGGTGTGPAVSRALADRDNTTVVLLTDGAPGCYPIGNGHNSGGLRSISDHRVMIQSNNVQGARINVFGINALGVYRAFCMAVAADSGGSYFDVP